MLLIWCIIKVYAHNIRQIIYEQNIAIWLVNQQFLNRVENFYEYLEISELMLPNFVHKFEFESDKYVS